MTSSRRMAVRVIQVAFVVLLAAASLLGVVLALPLPEPEVPQATRVLDADGRLVTSLFVENRETVPLSRIPPELRLAAIAVEDSRFYSHSGIDPIAVARAAIRNIRERRIVEGGSTITQQLAKNLFLTPERTVARKLHEAFLTLKLELSFSKDEILEMYLNQIYLGHGSYGVQVASKVYFGKDVEQLGLAESALLAGLIRSPENFSPYRHPDRARERMELVLDRMEELGFITPEAAAEARRAPIKLAGLRERDRPAAYFVDYVSRMIQSQRPDITTNELLRGGYRIHTTLDLDAQRAAEKALLRGLGEGTLDKKGVPQPQGALVAIDPRNGFIRAMVGGRDFRATQFNRAVPPARRQPGSAFKPFLYTAVIDSGFTAASVQRCEPVSFPGRSGIPYTPKDYGDGNYHFRDMTVREAIAISDNVVAVRWASVVGPSRVVDYARRMGIESPLDPTLPLVLGASEVSPLEMAAGYAPLANTGFRVRPMALVKLVDRFGREVIRQQPQITKVLDEDVAFVVTDLLKSVLAPGGTGSGLDRILGRPAAGKTGTSEGQRDAWFVGYTPELVAAVYVGNDDPATPVSAPGGRLAGPIWANFMRDALRGSPVSDFPMPSGVVRVRICPETGLLAPPFHPFIEEVFIRGTEPVAYCTEPHGMEPQAPPLPPFEPGQEPQLPEEAPREEAPDDRDSRGRPPPDSLPRAPAGERDTPETEVPAPGENPPAGQTGP